ncbi:MAG: class I SAM-dependent methyltransferase [Chitinophagaceae bacterium]|nr:class I SAM-dependent methyltransferase [Chitinophagaceae bacterium]
MACGTGRVTKHLLAKVAENGTLIATDLNADMIEIAKTKVQDQRVVWKIADAQELPFEDSYFDLVLCQFGVMFFPDKEKAFSEAHRVLKDEGQFLFNKWKDVKFNALADCTQQVMNELFSDNPSFFEKGPYTFFDHQKIKRLLKRANFNKIAIDEVPLSIKVPSFEDAIIGILDGTPLSSYIAERNVPKEIIKQRLKEVLTTSFGAKMELPMSALVCMAKK